MPQHGVDILCLTATAQTDGSGPLERNYNEDNSSWEIYPVSDYSMYFRGYNDGDPEMPPILTACQNSMKNNAGMYGRGSTGAAKEDVLSTSQILRWRSLLRTAVLHVFR